MNEIKTEQGFVAFFDILGYQQIIKNNDVKKAASIINAFIINVPSLIENKLKEIIEPFSKTDYEKELLDISQKLKCIILSDSIILKLPCSLEGSRAINEIMIFFLSCSNLMRTMFEKGLPLRGTISFGQYYINDTYTCLAGKPIVDAYTLTSAQNWSGCILDEEAQKAYMKPFLIAQIEPNALLKVLAIDYSVPFKSEERPYKVINWACLNNTLISKISGDIREFVTNAFLRHNKEVAGDVLTKINNTEIFIRHVNVNVNLE
jgi:hypothetical protein